MILWIALFVLVVALSYVLAAKSMRDYQEIPSDAGEYGLFLIRNRGGLTSGLLHSIHDELLSSGLNISFERVFKGNESALLVFGPQNLLAKFNHILNLLELEDYTNIDNTLAWEIEIKESGQKIFGNLPPLLDQEQFWWQLVLWVNKSKPMSSKLFHGQIRAVLKSEDPLKRKNVSQKLQNIDFYQKRSFQKKAKNNSFNSMEIIQLISI